MQPNPSPQSSGSPEPVIEIMDHLVPDELHAAAWQACSGKQWYFGHGSHPGDVSRFWKMDLDGDATFNTIWQMVRPRCEELAGGPLRVVRQYANGHTYGLGGNPHLDDNRPGTFTMLYYPNPEWKDGWDGETMFFDGAGEIAMAVRPRPNRGVFFDSRILHAGRAPSRQCPALRVTVAYKLELAQVAEPTLKAGTTGAGFEAREARRDGAERVYDVRIPESRVQEAVQQQLSNLASSVRLPGYKPGKIPAAVLEERYGVQARADALKRLGGEATQSLLPKGSVVSHMELKRGAESGDLEFQVVSTFLPDLPAVDFTAMHLERLAAPETEGASRAAFTRQHLKLQIMNFLDATYPVKLFPRFVDAEFAAIWKAAQAQGPVPEDPAERKALAEELRAIAERRMRLGFLMAEMARRYEISSQHGAEMEDKVVDYFVAHAHVTDRVATLEEIRDLDS